MKFKQFTNLLSTAKQVSTKSFSTQLNLIRGDLNKETLPQDNRDPVETSNAKGSSKTSTSKGGATDKTTSTGSSVSGKDSGVFTDEMKNEYNKMMNKDDKKEKQASPLQQDDLQTEPSQSDKDQSLSDKKSSTTRTINDVRNEQQQVEQPNK